MSTVSTTSTVQPSISTTTQIVVAVGFVQNDQGQVLMGLRHEPLLPEADNTWELPGGKVEHDEHPYDTVARELYEETGYKVAVEPDSSLVRDQTWEYPDRRVHTVVIAYRARLIGGQRSVQDAKVRDVAWVDPPDIAGLRLLGLVDEFVASFMAREGHHGSQ